MLSILKTGPGRTVRSVLLLVSTTCIAQYAVADSDLPNSVAALLPAAVQLKTHSWGVFETEFGHVISGQMGGKFTTDAKCDVTISPEFNLDLQGDTGWEASPEQLAMWEQMNAPDFQADAASMSSLLQAQVIDRYGKLKMAAPRYEQLPNGHITSIEFIWKCAKNPGGENVMLSGYAHRGATKLTFRFWVDGGSGKAFAMASEIFAKFEKLDLAELIKP